ncbi:hypothetical protein ACT3CD_01345 [Geofilum sp. OHC36d9]|uniref:hypothetical protein n=1 Tax=Geofilum sp. OHC36d9 TaxID=3458413 RepID=UPI00403360BF
MDKKSLLLRLAKSEKFEFAMVKDHFEDKHMAEVGFLMRVLITFLVFVLMNVRAFSQDVEQVVKAPMLITNGGFNVSQIAYYSPDSVAMGNDYACYLSGNFNASLFGVIQLPFSFAYTNNQATASLPQPFNRFSLSPSYRWITTHLGYGAMSFSPYTLSGHEFLGGGVELAPDNGFRFSALYGRFRKAVSVDSIGEQTPSPRRMGGGIMIGYDGDRLAVSVNVFKAKDQISSIDWTDDPAFEGVKPGDNLAGSMRLSYRTENGFLMMGEYGVSAINRDISSSDSLATDFGDHLFNGNGDVTVHHAFKMAIAQTTSLGRIGASYERVQPNYTTFGAYYFTNDFENITANLSSTLYKKVTIGLDAGYQRDNLENQKTNTAKRAIYSANISAPVTNRLSLGVAFSNVQSYMHIKDIYDEVTRSNEYQDLDTLSFTQLNRSLSVNAGYVLRATEQQRQNLNAVFSCQEASEQQSDDRRYVGSRIYNSTLSYLFAVTPSRLSMAATVNHNQNSMPGMTMHVLSYNVSVQKVFVKQFRTAFTGTYSNSFNADDAIANIVNLRLTGGYALKKRHNFNLSLAMVNNQAQRGHTTNYSVNLSYSYVFDMKLERGKDRLNFEGHF